MAPALSLADRDFDIIEEYAARMPTPVTLRQLYEFARNPTEATFVQAAQFIHKEIPIRLAIKVKELETAPEGLNEMHNIRVVRDWYVQSFHDMVNLPTPSSIADDRRMAQVLTDIKDRHANQVAVMAQGLIEYKERHSRGINAGAIQGFLDSFYSSRIGIRVLIGHYIALHRQRPGWSGIIYSRCAPAEVARQAARAASDLCRRTFGDPPDVRILGKTTLCFKYIPTHLHHMFLELLKNSFRAVIESHPEGAKLPPVSIVVAGGNEDVSIRISDEGGGVARSGIDKIFTYMYTTAQPAFFPGGERDIFAGLGYGLPITRIYARYFGGDLQIISLEGFGTDAFIYLSRLGNHHEALMS